MSHVRKKRKLDDDGGVHATLEPKDPVDRARSKAGGAVAKNDIASVGDANTGGGTTNTGGGTTSTTARAGGVPLKLEMTRTRSKSMVTGTTRGCK